MFFYSVTFLHFENKAQTKDDMFSPSVIRWMFKSSQSPHFQRFQKNCCGKDGLMQPYGSPNPIQSRALVYCVAPQADCLSYVHHHHGRNRLNNPRARYFIFWLWTNRSNTHIGQWVRAGRPCFLSLPKLPSSDLRQAVESEQQGRSRLGSRSCQAGWQRRRARTSSCCPAGGASGARHLHRGAVEEETKQRLIFKRGSGINFLGRIDQEEDWRCCWCKTESLGRR